MTVFDRIRALRAANARGIALLDSGCGSSKSPSFLAHSPTFELHHEEGEYFEHFEDSRTPVDPIEWLKTRGRTHVLIGYLGFEFGWEILDLPPGLPIPTENLWVGAYVEVERVAPESTPRFEPAVATMLTEPSRLDYVNAVEQAREDIFCGEMFEVNFTGRFQFSSSTDPLDVYLNLRSSSSGDYFAYIQTPAFTIASVSPELFLRVEQGRVTTSPIKGTRARGRSPEEDAQMIQELVMSEKDRAENVMIVDLMRNDLTPLSVPGSVKVDRLCEVETFAGVHHLVSTVSSQLLPNRTGMELLLSTFPAGSITGAPKLRAMEWIAQNEACARGPYTGTAFISWPNGDLISNVLIRTAVEEKGRWIYGAGGAVVSDSDPSEEFEEARTKARVFTTLAILVLILLAGCDRPHPSSQVARDVVDAVRHGDKETVWRLSTASSLQNEYCSAAGFQRVLERALRLKDEGICEQLSELQSNDLESVTDELVLYLQIQRAVCERPDLDCMLYSRLVFDSQWDALSVGASGKIVRIVGDDQSAVIYVDITKDGQIRPGTLPLILLEREWRVTSLEAFL